MKYTFTFLILISTLFAIKTQAQPRRYVARTFYLDLITFQHAFGAGIYGSQDAANWGFTYSPRANLIMLGDNTISFGTNLGLGLTGKGSESVKIIYDLPFVFDYNFGHKALIDNTVGPGGFVGAGYGFSLLRDEAGASKSQGIVFNAGARGPIADRSLTLRASYMLPLKKSRPSVYSVGIQYNF